MRNLLSLIGLAVVVFFGLGWYMGWYKLSAVDTPNGKRIELDVDKNKIANDVKKAEEKVHTILDNTQSPPAPTTAPGQPAFYIDPDGKMVFKPGSILK